MTVFTPSEQLHFTVVKVWHTIGGLYIWEYVSTFDYEWKVLRGQLRYRWTIWIYSLSRLAALLSIILFFVTADVTSPINCQLWMLFSIMCLCLSSIGASLLIVIRTIAIWNRNKIAVALSMTIWVTNIVFHVYNLAQIRIKWNLSEEACEPESIIPSAFGYISTILADMALLAIILTGLIVLRRNGGGTFGLTRLLWRQGVVWLILGTIIEIPSLIFTPLHLNDELRNLFQIPSLLVMTIAATRMHRSLIDFTSGGTEASHESQLRPLSSLVSSSKTKRTASASDQIKVSVTSEQFSKFDGESATITAFSTGEKITQLSEEKETV